MQNIRIVFDRIWKDIKSYWIAVLVLAVYNVIAKSVFHAFCPQLILTGFPCAGCGMTRAVFCILTGRFGMGMKLNPAAPLWILFLCCFFVNRYLRGVRSKSTKIFLGFVCLVTLVIYIYRMLHVFPGEPPMVYYNDNIMRKIIMGI